MVERGKAGRGSGAVTAWAVTRPSALAAAMVSSATAPVSARHSFASATAGDRTVKNSGIADHGRSAACQASAGMRGAARSAMFSSTCAALLIPARATVRPGAERTNWSAR